MKIMKGDSKKKEAENSAFLNEVTTMKNLSHSNIVNLVDYSNKAEAVRPDGSRLKLRYINLEYCEGGELFDFIAEAGRFTEEQARYYFHQLIDALEYMHKKGYKHRDIKPENILLDGKYNLKLADFGFTTQEDVSYTRKGTFGYMAPEVLAYEPYKGEEADLFAAAVILFILITQHPPFIRADPTDRYYKKVCDQQWDKFWDVHSDMEISDSFIDLFSKMISLDPKDRLTLNEIKEHEWYNGPVPTSEQILAEFTKKHKVVKRKLKERENKAPKKKTPAKNAAPVEEKKRKIPIKYTKFYKIADADELIAAVVDCSKHNKIAYHKSKEFFRVELKIQESESETAILVNVLKKPENEMRCLEFVMVSGDRSTFESIFTKFKHFCIDRFD